MIMKALLVCETRQGKLIDTAYELASFADRLGADRAFVVIGSDATVPAYTGTVYLAGSDTYGEYNPVLHTSVVLDAAHRENADMIVFSHSTYGWDLAPRVAASLPAALITELVDVHEGKFEVPCFNAKMRRIILPRTRTVVLTLQIGAFAASTASPGTPRVIRMDTPVESSDAGHVEFAGYETAPKKGLDLGRAEVIVSAGRGIGKRENLPVIAALADALGGELGATRPIVDAGWVEYSRQVGSTGQIVSPKLYIACGISGAIQHLTGMRKSGFIVAINKDVDAPITAVADVLVPADVMQFVPAFTARVKDHH
jgi:electron transfer flavoprotein alpha subunit